MRRKEGEETITMSTMSAITTTAPTVAMAAMAPLLKGPFLELEGVFRPNRTVRGCPVEPVQSQVTAPEDDVVVQPSEDHESVAESYRWHEGPEDEAREPVEKVVFVVPDEPLCVGSNGTGAVSGDVSFKEAAMSLLLEGVEADGSTVSTETMG